MMQQKSIVKFYVYKITNTINNKVYIGKSNTSINRWSRHKEIARNKYPNTYHHLHKSINKYGVENFIYEIIEYFDDENDAYDAESKYIKLYHSNNDIYGMNLNTGGNRTFSQNPEVGAKISASKMGFKFTEESKIKMSKSHALQRPKNPKFTDEQIIEIRREYNLMKLFKYKNISKLLSSKYDVAEITINYITNGKNYKHIPLEEQFKINDNMKVCARCNQIKLKNNFYISNCKRHKDGLSDRCIECDKQAGGDYYQQKKIKK